MIFKFEQYKVEIILYLDYKNITFIQNLNLELATINSNNTSIVLYYTYIMKVLDPFY